MEDLFYHAQNKLLQDTQCPIVTSRLQNIKIATITRGASPSCVSSDHYRRYRFVPAYYDPNIHTVFLNSRLLGQMDSHTVFIVCYHELVHGASLHYNYKLPGLNIFQSGIKFERYKQNGYTCFNRLLNEGMVQFITTIHNNLKAADYAYPREVEIVTLLAKDLGIEVIKNALFYEQYTQLKTRFDAHYGTDAFTRFTAAIDQKRYDTAKAILNQSSQPTHALHYPLAPFSSFGVMNSTMA